MIHPKVQFGEIKTDVVDFGKGKLEMLLAENDEYRSLLIKKAPKKPAEVEYETSDDFNPELVLVFRNRKNLDHLLGLLLELRDQFGVEKGQLKVNG